MHKVPVMDSENVSLLHVAATQWNLILSRGFRPRLPVWSSCFSASLNSFHSWVDAGQITSNYRLTEDLPGWPKCYPKSICFSRRVLKVGNLSEKCDMKNAGKDAVKPRWKSDGWSFSFHSSDSPQPASEARTPCEKHCRRFTQSLYLSSSGKKLVKQYVSDW